MYSSYYNIKIICINTCNYIKTCSCKCKIMCKKICNCKNVHKLSKYEKKRNKKLRKKQYKKQFKRYKLPCKYGSQTGMYLFRQKQKVL